MPIEAKPLFRPDVLRGHLEGFTPPARVAQVAPKLAQWAELIRSGQVDIRQTRLYYKGSNQQTYERFDTERLASDPVHLHKLVYLLGAERVLPPAGACHLYELMAASERAGRELTKEFYRSYAQLREEAFDRISADNPSADACASRRWFSENGQVSHTEPVPCAHAPKGASARARSVCPLAGVR